MAMKTLYFKEHEGLVHNPIGQLSPVPWWSAIGSQSVYGESCGQLKPFSMEQPPDGDQLTASTKQAGRSTEQGLDRGNASQFTISLGDCKTLSDGQKPPQIAISLQTAMLEYLAHFEPGSGQPMICAKYPHISQCHNVIPAYGTHISGRIMLPLNTTTDDGPIFVNPKQYHGILRRRKSRAKAELKNRLTKARKPYMHYSRHLHAKRRPRGSGGRFLNTKTMESGKGGSDVKKAIDVQTSPPTGSQRSEVLQSDSGTLNAPKEADGGGSNLSSSEVTSVYSRGDLNRFQTNHIGPPLLSFSGIMDGGHGIVLPTKWVAAADNCRNLKF